MSLYIKLIRIINFIIKYLRVRLIIFLFKVFLMKIFSLKVFSHKVFLRKSSIKHFSKNTISDFLILSMIFQIFKKRLLNFTNTYFFFFLSKKLFRLKTFFTVTVIRALSQ